MIFLKNIVFSIIAGGLIGVTAALAILWGLGDVMGVTISDNAELWTHLGCSALAAVYVYIKASAVENPTGTI